jgi:hypothetical protein
MHAPVRLLILALAPSLAVAGPVDRIDAYRLDHPERQPAELVSDLMDRVEAHRADDEPVCPDGAFSAVRDGLAHCMFEILEFPEAVLLPHCDYLEDGTLGFRWEGPEMEDTFSCPEGARYATTGEGDNYCLFEGLLPWLPADSGLAPHCDWVADGLLGYSWPL